MVIQRMNQTFDKHGKKFMFVLLVLISIAFIGFFAPGSGSCALSSGDNAEVTTIFGEPVSSKQLNQHAQMMSVSGVPSLYLRQPESNQAALNNALIEMAALNQADKIGVTVTDEEVEEYILNTFANAEVYNSYLSRISRSYGYNESRFKRAVRDAMRVNRYFQTMIGDALITPSEAKASNQAYNTVYNGSIRWFRTEDYAKSITTTDTKIIDTFNKANLRYQNAEKKYNDARKAQLAYAEGKDFSEQKSNELSNATASALNEYNAAREEAYIAPARFDGVVVYVKKDDPRYLEKAKAQVKDEQLKKYYDEHQSDYMDNVATLDEAEAKVKPFDAVKAEIRALFEKNEVSRMGYDAIRAFSTSGEVEALNPSQSEQFIKMAEKAGLQSVCVSDISLENYVIPGVGAEAGIGRAFDVTRERSGMIITDVVNGDSAILVGMRTSIKPESFKTLEQVRPQIIERLQQIDGRTRAQSEATMFMLNNNSILNSNPAHVDTILATKFTALPPFAYNADSAINEPWFDAMYNAVINTKTGRISNIFPENPQMGNQCDAFGVVYLSGAVTPEQAAFSDTKSQLYIETQARKRDLVLHELFFWLQQNIGSTGR